MPPKHIYYAKYPSHCHRASVVIVKNDAGRVSQHCTQCGNAEPLDLGAMPEYFHCPLCNKPVTRVKRTKTLFECSRCSIKWELEQIVPAWRELFPDT